ncbi:MAG TPA: hypothetical protein VK191_13800 [Symbiobacteriaceae bacterium]|nr:hypothetical protein [Symbiobacteriaceae bacterium]
MDVQHLRVCGDSVRGDQEQRARVKTAEGKQGYVPIKYIAWAN